MEPAFVALGLFSLFAATHLTLGNRPIREPLVRRFGEFGFELIFSAVAAVTFGSAIIYFATHRFEGAAGFALGTMPVVREILITALTLGVVLITAGLMNYAGSRYALGARTREVAARGLERVTRHAFLIGMSMFALAHSLLATHLIGTLSFATLGVFPLIGAWHQDRKLLVRYGKLHADYMAVTSSLPFAAILSGKQAWAPRELPWRAVPLGLGVAFALSYWHHALFAWGGAPLLGSLLVLATFELVADLLRRRKASTPHSHEEDELRRMEL